MNSWRKYLVTSLASSTRPRFVWCARNGMMLLLVLSPYAFFEDSVMEFGKDLQDSQELQSKVKSLRVDKHRKYSHGSSNKFMTQVFPFCANLEELILAINPTNNTYAKKLGNEYKNCSITSPMPRLNASV